jgi:hypothetical protein
MIEENKMKAMFDDITIKYEGVRYDLKPIEGNYEGWIYQFEKNGKFVRIKKTLSDLSYETFEILAQQALIILSK